MKNILLGIVIGLAAGITLTWLVSRHPVEAEHEKKHEEAEKHEEGVHLTKEQQASAGLAVAKPEPLTLKPEVKAFGRALDAVPLANLLAEIETARSALAASAKEFERLKTLGENAAARALEAAEAAATRDRVALEAAQARLLATWGKPLATRSNLTALTRSLLDQQSALVRVDVAAGEVLPSAPREVRIAPVTGRDEFREMELLGPAPTTDSQAQGVAFLGLMHEHAPIPGTILSVRITCDGAPQTGFEIPRPAVLRHEGATWVFVQTGDEQFARKQVTLGPSRRDAAFVTNGLKAEDRVVVTGGQQLLSEELKGTGGEE